MKPESAVFEMAAGLREQLPVSDLPEVAFSGRSNVGKSSLINSLCRRKGMARTSAAPGKTATVNFYRLSTMRMVDLPGYGYAKVSEAEKKRWNGLIRGYLEEDRDLRLVLQLLDIRHAPSAEDRMMLDFFVDAEIPFIVVLTKADKLNRREFTERMAAFEKDLEDYEGVTFIPVSSSSGDGLEDIREIITTVTEEE